MIERSVGQQGVNSKNDVLVIQNALNVVRAANGQDGIAIDGLVGPETIGAITAFQQQERLAADGRIDVGGPTLRRLRSALGEEAAVFAPTISQLIGVLDILDRLAHFAPPRAKRSYVHATSRLRGVSRFKDLARGLPSDPPFALASFRAGPNVFGFTGVDDAAALLALILLAFLVAAVLVIMTQSPAFRKAVEARAKELDRIMGELKIHMSVGFNEAIQLVLSIANDTIDEANRCRKSPTFTPSPECEEAQAQFIAVANRIRRQFSEVTTLILLFTSGSGRGLSVGSLRVEINRLLRSLQKNAFDLQVALAEMKEKCNCPDI